MTGIIAGAIFVALFVAWVIAPSRIKKMHESKKEME